MLSTVSAWSVSPRLTAVHRHCLLHYPRLSAVQQCQCLLRFSSPHRCSPSVLLHYACLSAIHGQRLLHYSWQVVSRERGKPTTYSLTMRRATVSLFLSSETHCSLVWWWAEAFCFVSSYCIRPFLIMTRGGRRSQWFDRHQPSTVRIWSLAHESGAWRPNPELGVRNGGCLLFIHGSRLGKTTFGD